MDGLMVPKIAGEELYALEETQGAIAFAGTGFDEDSRQHRFGSDALRYAIAIQQYRDAGDFAKVDAARAFAETFYVVMQGAGSTRLLTKPLGYDRLSKKDRRAALALVRMPVIDGIIYDGKGGGA